MLLSHYCNLSYKYTIKKNNTFNHELVIYATNLVSFSHNDRLNYQRTKITDYRLNIKMNKNMKSIISFFKFTPTEAAGIKPLVENHFLLFWLYNIMDLIPSR